MSSFSIAASQADAENRPIARGVAAKIPPGGDRAKLRGAFEGVFPEGEAWSVSESPTGWISAVVADASSSDEAWKLSLGEAWERCRVLTDVGFEQAEPLLLITAPSPDGPRASGFGVWGLPYSPEVAKRIREGGRDHRWSITQMNLPAAWSRFTDRAPGEGVLVAHPDTGYSDHPSIGPRFRRPGKNYVEDDGDGRDRFVAGLLMNPGHGTATASVIAGSHDESDSGRGVFGVAPGAEVLPMRVSNSVVHFDFANVAQAIEDAVDEGAHVISMSLGGPVASGRLRDAVHYALDKGVVVVSAAGNMVPFVVFPAAIPGVVAMAASNPAEIPWRFSAFGTEVTATAPGEAVWKASASGDGAAGFDQSSGTSYATAATAGLAALWLSHFGREEILAHLEGETALLPYAFITALQDAANPDFEFVGANRDRGFGAGIVDADKLLRSLPPIDAVRRRRDRLQGLPAPSLVDLTLRELVMLFRVPTRARGLGAAETAANTTAIAPLVERLAGGLDPQKVSELAKLLQGVAGLRSKFATALAQAGTNEDRAVASVARALLSQPMSPALREAVEAAGRKALEILKSEPAGLIAPVRHRPNFRRLRAYSFDPSFALSMKTRTISEVTIEVPWEGDLQPGPVGEYLEVIDVDPATDCVYMPVDLNDRELLAQDGLPPSEGNPQFHQQMVYAVAMKTIKHFESALGRPIFWSAVRPTGSEFDRAAARHLLWPDGEPNVRDQYVQRLRIYPHALREANAYYSPNKRALLFGYFPATTSSPAEVYPGGMVFTCLSHDVIAHETTHAVLDGMHVLFAEATNPDVYAFHEAFSDVVALFQHFSYPAVLRDQIGRTRGNLESESELVKLAQEFGQSVGRHQSLRDVLGKARVTREQATRVTPVGEVAGAKVKVDWQRYEPDASLLDRMDYAGEAHARGSILVAAIFDAFLSIYKARVQDLLRIATGGRGVLPDGELQNDLAERLSHEAAKSAQHVLRMCIRALDYTPPIDITFGEYLRALITADRDLVPNDVRGYRTAFIQAFRAWGIYPRDVRTLSEESLVWSRPEGMNLYSAWDVILDDAREEARKQSLENAEQLRNELARWKPGADRREVFENILDTQAKLKEYFDRIITQREGAWGEALRESLMFKVNGQYMLDDEPWDWTKRVNFRVSNVRPARRVGPNGEYLVELVMEITRRAALPGDRNGHRYYGGMTVIVDMSTWDVNYIINKRLNSPARIARTKAYLEQSQSQSFGAAEYRCGQSPGAGRRSSDLEAMRASSCECRQRTKKKDKAEPFAMLHRGSEVADAGDVTEAML
ncbi:MAG: S8 family serine peptidase [Fimbriimonas sp.]